MCAFSVRLLVSSQKLLGSGNVYGFRYCCLGMDSILGKPIAIVSASAKVKWKESVVVCTNI